MTRGKCLTVGIGIALATLLGSVSAARAQYAAPPPAYAPPPPYYPPPPPPPPPRGVYRSGLVYGGSIGVGTFSFSGCGDICGGAISGEVHIGGMIGPRLALEGDFWGSTHFFSDVDHGNGETFNGIYTLALQYWLTDQLWIKGGIGLANIQISSDDTDAIFDDETGFGFMLAAGIEIVQSYNFALDLQLRYGNATYKAADNGGTGDGDTNMVAFLVGFNWY